jgi:4,5-dihydroxyphthalate decarboxylase
MSNLKLSLICGANDRTQPIIDGSVRPDGIELDVTVAHPSEIFWRQLTNAEFDISEMSMSSFLIITAQGDRRFVGLPVFTSRRFFHAGALVRTDRGIDRPEDLKGKRIGVPEYQQTAALWSRGALQHEFGVRPSDIEWYMERTVDRSHGGATGFTAPPGVRINFIPAEKNIGTMMASGELDGTVLYITDPNPVDRSRLDLDNDPNIKRLFPDPAAEGARYYQKTGLYPINHGIVVKRELLERHPWIAINLYKAFSEARDRVAERTRQLAAVYFDLGLLPQDKRSAIAIDPYPYGVQANRTVLETIAEYSHEQGLTPRHVKLNEVFAPSTMDL